MAVGRAEVVFLCENCGAHTHVYLGFKDTNNDNVKETNYSNITCPQCSRVYAIKVLVEDRGFQR